MGFPILSKKENGNQDLEVIFLLDFRISKEKYI